jgi:4-oxalocrotonate tautomerase
MPHVIVKLYPGRSEQEKARLAERIVKDLISTLNNAQESVSVAIQEVNPADWAEKVYRPDILGHQEDLYKKPGYDPFE